MIFNTTISRTTEKPKDKNVCEVNASYVINIIKRYNYEMDILLTSSEQHGKLNDKLFALYKCVGYNVSSRNDSDMKVYKIFMAASLLLLRDDHQFVIVLTNGAKNYFHIATTEIWPKICILIVNQ